MFSIKEALLAKSRSMGAADTAIFYIDMRTFGKDFQRYRDSAEKESGRAFHKEPSPFGRTGSRRVSPAPLCGRRMLKHDEVFDMVVLAAGQRPPEGSEALAQLTGTELNPEGFCRTEALFTGMNYQGRHFCRRVLFRAKDVSESLILADSASLGGLKLIFQRRRP